MQKLLSVTIFAVLAKSSTIFQNHSRGVLKILHARLKATGQDPRKNVRMPRSLRIYPHFGYMRNASKLQQEIRPQPLLTRARLVLFDNWLPVMF